MKWIKCLFTGHKWHYISRTEKTYFCGRPCPRNYAFTDDTHTIFLYKCEYCSRIKEKELKGFYGDIPADELIEN